jgi:hypothetical protein
MKDFPVDSWKTPLVPEVNVDPRKNNWGILNTMKVSSKHSESVYCDFRTIEGIKIMVILVIELSPKYQMQDWIYCLVV